MEIFQRELDDGLGPILSDTSNATAKYTAEILPNSFVDKSVRDIIERAIATNNDQPDLQYISSILVTTGWNYNDDVFNPEEVWNARNTPEDKPFNYEHNEEDIIGHITSNIVVDDNKNLVANDTPADKLPDRFHILTTAVLYKVWQNPELQERMSEILTDIQAGRKYVSMEALFTNFDYAIISPKGNYYLTRSDKTSFLTKYLRIYGGTGVYNGCRVGRAIKNIVFSGKGLVAKPANPNSIIFSDLQKVDSEKISILVSSENKSMANDTDKVDVKPETVSVELSNARNELFAVSEKLSAAEKLIAELQTAKAESDSALAEKVAELDAIRIAAERDARLAKLIEAGLNETDATAKLDKFASLSDELFTDVVDTIKAMKTMVPEKTIVKTGVKMAPTVNHNGTNFDPDDKMSSPVVKKMGAASADEVIEEVVTDSVDVEEPVMVTAPEATVDNHETRVEAIATYLSANHLKSGRSKSRNSKVKEIA